MNRSAIYQDRRQERISQLYLANRDALHCAMKDGPRTNDDRVQEAMVLCKVMSALTGVDLYDDPDNPERISESVIGDLLAHIMHLCHVEGHDFTDLARIASNHFEGELFEEEEEEGPLG